MKHKFLISCYILFLSAAATMAQVCGVSASKLGACNATPVPLHSLEFEPVFSSLWSRKFWNQDSRIMPRFESTDSLEHNTSLTFRTTYGINRNAEVGFLLSSNHSQMGMAGKIRFLQTRKNELAWLAGYHYERPEGQESNPGRPENISHSAVAGLSWTTFLPANWSVDTDFQWQTDYFQQKTGTQVFFNADAGCFIKPGLQAILGISYNRGWGDTESGIRELTTLNLGGSIETGENFLLVFGFPVDLYGKNEICQTGFVFAVTMIFD
ncbi:MAG TPA: hypothetical protein ENN63_00855 [Bacteroidetes bacterium]|nr:hypothetical protein [Bacteroidota bacterium]